MRRFELRSERWLSALGAVAYVALAIVASVWVYESRAWNLDGVFYSALIAGGVGCDVGCHRDVYSALDAEAPAAARRALADGEYRHRAREDAGVFALQLPFYSSKLLYTWAGRALHALGVSSPSAPYVVAVASFALIALGLPWFAMRLGSPPLAAFTLSAVAILSPQLRELGKLAAPDALAALCLLLGIVCAAAGSRWFVGFIVLATLARPDCVVLSIAILIASSTGDPRGQPAKLRLLATGLLAGALVIVQVSQSYGWPILMHHTFVRRVMQPADLSASFGVVEYFGALKRGLSGYMTRHSARWVPFAILALVCVFRARHANGPQRTALRLLVAMWVATGLRFLAFPVLADRFFAPAYLCTIVLAGGLVQWERAWVTRRANPV